MRIYEENTNADELDIPSLSEQELLDSLPEESIFLEEKEALELRRLFQCAHAAYPSLPFQVLVIAISSQETLFSYVPTRAERDALGIMNARNPIESQFLSLLKTCNCK